MPDDLTNPGRPDRDRVKEARAHADLEQVEVRAHQFEFVAESRMFAAQLRQGRAQVTHQAGDRVRPGLWLRAIQAPHVAQHVEQEMRLDLRLQQRQLLFGLVPPQLGLRSLQRMRGSIGLQRALVHVGDHRQHDGRQAIAQRIGQQAQRRRQMVEAVRVVGEQQHCHHDRQAEQQRAKHRQPRGCAVAALRRAACSRARARQQSLPSRQKLDPQKRDLDRREEADQVRSEQRLRGYQDCHQRDHTDSLPTEGTHHLCDVAVADGYRCSASGHRASRPPEGKNATILRFRAARNGCRGDESAVSQDESGHARMSAHGCDRRVRPPTAATLDVSRRARRLWPAASSCSSHVLCGAGQRRRFFSCPTPISYE